MNDLARELKDKELEWRNSIECCDKCGGDKMTIHEDGVQCFECNHIIYFPGTGNQAISPKGEVMLKETAMEIVTKPDGWEKFGNRQKRDWYLAHIDEIMADYLVMPYTLLLEKWSISSATVYKLRAKKGIKTNRHPYRSPDKGGEKVSVSASHHIGPAVLVITQKDLVCCSDAKFTKLWTVLGKVIRARSSAKSAVVV